MKRFFSLSLLALMLSACVMQPASALSYPAQIFTAGFVTGMFPILGQSLGLGKFVIDQQLGLNGENISFVTGHALGMSLWAIPLYLGRPKLAAAIASTTSLISGFIIYDRLTRDTFDLPPLPPASVPKA